MEENVDDDDASFYSFRFRAGKPVHYFTQTFQQGRFNYLALFRFQLFFKALRESLEFIETV